MVILLRILVSLAFVVTLSILFTALLNSLSLKVAWQAIPRQLRNWLAASLRRPAHPRYPIELYIWKTKDDEAVCEDCLERAGWAPMDIADWMKEGLPGTPEAACECGERCRCRLVRFEPSLFSEKPHQH